jgi:hypothetical protein
MTDQNNTKVRKKGNHKKEGIKTRRGGRKEGNISSKK